MVKNKTSWGNVAPWYDEYLSDGDTYQAKVIWPNLKRVLGFDPRHSRLLDMACGQGYFSYLTSAEGYTATGIDVAKELIEIAKNGANMSVVNNAQKSITPEFMVAPAHDVSILKSESFDVVICILALQNIRELDQAIAECRRLLVPGGRFIFVLNHPSFRVPQHSDWYFDEKKGIQSRLVSKYMQEATINIDMQPGSRHARKQYTVSFHRPLQLFIKLLAKHRFVVSRLEEWCSHKKTEAGPRKAAEDEARKEIPMFMCIETTSL